MTSKARSQNKFLYPEFNQHDSIEGEKAHKQRQSTVYDAVAGRISAAGFIPKYVVISSTRDTASSSASAVAPEAVLFRRKNAPTRYAESDFYFANEREEPGGLPDSDLLKAVHCYASDFYSRATVDAGAGDWRSLDETALMALGILMEEVSRESLGQAGDLALTEGEEVPVLATRTSKKSSKSNIILPEIKARTGSRAKRRRLLDKVNNG